MFTHWHEFAAPQTIHYRPQGYPKFICSTHKWIPAAMHWVVPMGQVSLDFVIPMDTAANDYGLTCGVHMDVVKAVNKLKPKSGLPCRLIPRPSTESTPPVLEHWRCRRPGTRLLHSTNKIGPHIDLSVTMWASATYRLYQEPENWTSHWTLLCVLDSGSWFI